jgi:glycosyltransferase involved in cell wall biosynthesis
VVAVVHDFANFRVAGQSDPLRNAYRRFLVLRALRSATELVAVSDATRADLVDLLGPEAPPMRVVGNGVDTDRFTPRSPDDPDVCSARARVGLGTRYVLYPARLELPAKNHLRLLAAFESSKACAGHELALCGADWGAGGAIEQEIVRRGLTGRVKRLGYVADRDLPLLVAGARAVAMVGLHEGFGLPALEALAAGRAVIASRTGALPEVVGELGVLCDPTDVGSIAAALDRGLTDELLRARCATRGPGWARARSWEGTAQGLLAACETALRRGRS